MRIFISLLLAIILVLSVTSYRLYIESKTIAIEQTENNQSEKSIDEREADSDAIDTKKEPKDEKIQTTFIAKKIIKNCSQSSQAKALCKGLVFGNGLGKCILTNSISLGPECEKVTHTLATTLKLFCTTDLKKVCFEKQEVNRQFECLASNKHNVSRKCWLNIGLSFFE